MCWKCSNIKLIKINKASLILKTQIRKNWGCRQFISNPVEIIEDKNNVLRQTAVSKPGQMKKKTKKQTHLVVRQRVQKGNACWAASGGCSMLICIFSIKYSQPEGPQSSPLWNPRLTKVNSGSSRRFLFVPSPIRQTALVPQHVIFCNLAQWMTHKATTVW